MDTDFRDFLLTHVGGWLGEFKTVFVEQVGDEVQNAHLTPVFVYVLRLSLCHRKENDT